MNFIKNSNWSILALTLLCCFVFQIVSADNRTIEVDSRFDKGSASLARTWQHFKGSLPHDKLPDNSEEIKHPSEWAKNYGVGLAKIVGPGFVIAILSLLAGIIYGIFKLIRMCCCSRSDEESEEEESSEDPFTWSQKWIPTILYAVFFVFLLTGMIFGILNNPRFSDGVNDMSGSVIDVGNEAITLGNGLNDAVGTIVDLVPETITQIQNQFAGVDPLADEVLVLSDDINATSSQVAQITTSVSQINLTGANITAVTNLYTELASINNSSAQIISQMADLTSEIATKLRSTLNNTIGTLDSKVGEIDDTVDGLQSTAQGIIKDASDLVDKVIKYVNDGKDYNKIRGTVVLVVFVVVIVFTFAIIGGFIFKFKPIFNIVAALGFVFLFLLWLSGSIHFLLGMALYDACPVIDVTVQGLLPSDSEAADVLQGCLYEHRTVLESLNITAYNLTDVFDYKSDFEEFANFSSGFNFSSVDAYFDNIHNLYSYNLSAVADNITVESFGWNQSYVYQALDALNNATSPTYYGLNNYTLANPNSYSPPHNQTVYDAKEVLKTAIATNTSIYNQTAIAKQQLYAAQQEITDLLSNLTIFQNRYDGIKTDVNVLETQNISNCIAILDHLQANITGFFELGNCSFLGDAYVNIKISLCDTMQPSIDILTVAQFLAGLALIPMVILAEVLSFRIPKCRNLNPLGYGDGDDDYDEEKGTHTSTPFKYGKKRNSGISATISADTPAANSASSSPDFSAARRNQNQVHPMAAAPLLHNQQKPVLPPLKTKSPHSHN